MAAELYDHQCRKVTLSNILLLHGIRYDICGKGATIQYPGGGGGWSFCREQIIYFNRARRRAENLTFYYMFI